MNISQLYCLIKTQLNNISNYFLFFCIWERKDNHLIQLYQIFYGNFQSNFLLLVLFSVRKDSCLFLLYQIFTKQILKYFKSLSFPSLLQFSLLLLGAQR